MNVDVLRDLVTTLQPYLAQTQPPTTPVFNTPTVPKRRRRRSQRWNSRCVRTPPAQLQVTVAAPAQLLQSKLTRCQPPLWCRRPQPSRHGTTTGRVISTALLRRTYAPTSRKSTSRGISAQRQPAGFAKRHWANAYMRTCMGTSPQERRQAEFAPHIGSWANSMVAVLEAVRKLLKQQTFEDVVEIFGQREWYPRNGHCNAALSVAYAEVACIMGRPILSEDIQVSPPNHPVALLNWWSLTLMLAEQPATK